MLVGGVLSRAAGPAGAQNATHQRLQAIDEGLAADSSRFWPPDVYKPGKGQPSFDKQFVRDYLDKIKFDRTPPGPPLPAEIVQKTRAKYIEAYTRLTGQAFPWE